MSHVLDASALLAYAHSESGAARVFAFMGSACLITVDLSEAVAEFVEHDTDYTRLQNETQYSAVTLVPCAVGNAYPAGDLRRTTRRFGLAFGDRVGLTLAHCLDLPALTTDRSRETLDIGITIEAIC